MGTDGSESKLAVAGSVGLILAIAGVVLTQSPLKSSRPVEGGADFMKESVRERTVQARLWEDPLQAVQRVKEENLKGTKLAYQPGHFISIRTTIEEMGKTQSLVDILVVMTDGSSYAEGKEDRIRDRYAIASALGVACYVPEDEDHLSYAKWSVAGKDRSIPYEWYRERKTRRCSDNGNGARAVLVLWVTGEILHEHPIDGLERLTGSLLCKHSHSERTNCARQHFARIKVLGPHSSSEFRHWLEEAGRKQIAETPAWLSRDGTIELYSPWATAIPKLLTNNILSERVNERDYCPKAEECSYDEFDRILKHARITLKYSIGSDDQLLKALVEELERRNVKLQEDAVVLIGEWDSFYGRALPIEFRAAVCAQIAATPGKYAHVKAETLTAIRKECPTLEQAIDFQVKNQKGYEKLNLNVWRYSYLRGLDGQVPGEKQENVSSRKERDNGDRKKDNLLDFRFLERPVGPSQLDYTRRLADRIEGETGKNDNKVRAVGILGTDPYDALLILQALRERFPTAVFFVTDLDARLVYSDEYRWTRNLVIASHFGLTLSNELQRDVPPFRSGYQSSVFFATLQAVGHVQSLFCPPLGAQGPPAAREGNGRKKPCGYRANLADEWFDATEPPRLYEVGRHGAVDLSVGLPQDGYESLHPGRPDLEKGSRNGLRPHPSRVQAVLVLCSLAVFAGLLMYQGTRQWMDKVPLKWGVMIVSLIVALAYLFGAEWTVQKTDALVGKLVSAHDVDEPFGWFEGVSIWPTEMIRLFAALLAVCLLVKGLLDLRLNKKEVEGQFQLFGFSGEQTGLMRFAESWLATTGWRRRKDAWLMVLGRPSRGARERVDVSWSLYIDAGSMAALFLRVAAIYYVIRHVLLDLVLTAIGNPDWSTPCRGKFSCSIDGKITRELLLPAATLLTAFALDQAMLCCRWIGILSRATEGWPHPTTDQEDLLNKVRLVAKRTEVVNSIIKYPPLIWLLIIGARNNYFDHWSFPPQLIAAWSINLMAAFAPAVLLYLASERMRSELLDRLNRDLHRQLRWGKSAENEVTHTRNVIKDVESIKKGAFLPLWQQPFVQTILYGVVALLQYLYLGT